MGTSLGLKYIPYSYMEPLGYILASAALYANAFCILLSVTVGAQELHKTCARLKR